ncbi:MAG: hypothetical protein J1F02_05345 [Lachnospiraceae bacterium]|nr:hypothetical protein [Lachnospiraceae bacterium]
MKKSYLFLTIIFIVIIGMGVLFFFLYNHPQSQPETGIGYIIGNPDVEEAKTVPKERWTVFNEHELAIDTETQFKNASELTIPATYDGKQIYSFEITFTDNCDEAPHLKHVVIEEGIRSFSEMGCFVPCTNLETVVIPETVTWIGKWEFKYCADTVTLYVKKGSYAEKYAKKHKLKYRYGKPEEHRGE